MGSIDCGTRNSSGSDFFKALALNIVRPAVYMQTMQYPVEGHLHYLPTCPLNAVTLNAVEKLG